jgi:hypothetical protein
MVESLPVNQIPNIHLAKSLTCKKCTSKLFNPAFNLKTLSALASPNGKIMNLHFQVWVCIECHTVKELPK